MSLCVFVCVCLNDVVCDVCVLVCVCPFAFGRVFACVCVLKYLHVFACVCVWLSV